MEWLATFDAAFTTVSELVTSRAGIAAVSMLIMGAAAGIYWLGFKRDIKPLLRDHGAA